MLKLIANSFISTGLIFSFILVMIFLALALPYLCMVYWVGGNINIIPEEDKNES